MFKKFIGDKKFYKSLFLIAFPIILQQFLTNFVNMIDNLMIGSIGNDETVGVSLANQVLFVFNLTVFGILSGASIFGTQYFGGKDKEGYHEVFRFKWLIGLTIVTIAITIMFFFRESLLSFFINEHEGDYSDPNVVLSMGDKYLLIMFIGLIPFLIKEIYASSLREMKETFFPMVCGGIAIFVNLLFNYLLIFGKLGFPELGVVGAAIATVISRLVELILIVAYTYIKKDKFSILDGAFKKLFPSIKSIKMFLPKTLLLTSNEFLWSLGLTLIIQSYSYRGLDFIAANNICNTINNVFITTGTSLGSATAIILGNFLGNNQIEEAKASSYKIMLSSVVFALFLGLIEMALAFVIPNAFNTTVEIKEMSRHIIMIAALVLPIRAFNTCIYFTLRSGGMIVITMLFDSMFVLLVRFPLAYILSRYTTINPFLVIFIVNGIDIVEVFIGYILVSKGVWLKKIV